MRKKSRKQLQEDAEQEYYEKESRQARWHRIKYAVGELLSRLKRLHRDYCECTGCSNKKYRIEYWERYGDEPPDCEEYCERCREESQLIRRLIDEMSGLHEIVEEGYGKYGELNPVRPLHLP
ncbi:MAG: hypothetical protein IJG39_10245 [Synergistaceae bacterium]|nr:hypothetical protein [Synergistaceae bacterium]